MRKVQISYNEYYYGFYEFCDGCFDFPVDMPLEHCGYCLRVCLFTVYLLLHFSLAIADFCRKAAPYALLVSGLRQKCYGVTSGNFAVCKFALRAFVPAVSLPFRNNFSFAVKSIIQHQYTESVARCIFISKKISVIRYFDECCYLS